VSTAAQALDRGAYAATGRDFPPVQFLFGSLTKTGVGEPELPILEPDLIVLSDLVTDRFLQGSVLGLQRLLTNLSEPKFPFECANPFAKES
jgi:hypothetical protein